MELYHWLAAQKSFHTRKESYSAATTKYDEIWLFFMHDTNTDWALLYELTENFYPGEKFILLSTLSHRAKNWAEPQREF